MFLGEAEHIWMHIDAAYAGSAFVCPEYRHFMKGIQVNVHFKCFTTIHYILMHCKSYGPLHACEIMSISRISVYIDN